MTAPGWRRTGRFERWRGEVNTFGFQRHLVGDFEDGRIYDMRLDYYLDDAAGDCAGAAYAERGSHAATASGIACSGCAWMRAWASTVA